MLKKTLKKRWPADRCLDKGFDNGLFMRRDADDLVVGVYDASLAAFAAEGVCDEKRMPIVGSPLDIKSFRRTDVNT